MICRCTVLLCGKLQWNKMGLANYDRRERTLQLRRSFPTQPYYDIGNLRIFESYKSLNIVDCCATYHGRTKFYRPMFYKFSKINIREIKQAMSEYMTYDEISSNEPAKLNFITTYTHFTYFSYTQQI